MLLAALLLLLAAAAPALVPLPLDDNDHNQANAYIFRPGELATIEVTMSPAALDSMLDNPWSDEMRLCSVRFANSIIDEVIAVISKWPDYAGDIGVSEDRVEAIRASHRQL